jgi:hypothetical protein
MIIQVELVSTDLFTYRPSDFIGARMDDWEWQIKRIHHCCNNARKHLSVFVSGHMGSVPSVLVIPTLKDMWKMIDLSISQSKRNECKTLENCPYCQQSIVVVRSDEEFNDEMWKRMESGDKK